MMRYLVYVLLLCALGAAIHHRSSIIAELPATIRDHLPAAPSPAPTPAEESSPAAAATKKIETTNTALPPFTLRTLDGSATVDSSLIRGQITLITFFSGWCRYCQQQMPIERELKRRYPSIRTIGVIYKDTPEKALAMLHAQGNPFDVVYIDPEGLAAKAMGTRGVPNNFIIDTRGAIRLHMPGAIIDSGEITRFFVPLLNQLSQEPVTPK